VDDGAGGTTRVGLGGDAGSIELAADLDPADPDAELPGGDLRVVTVDGSVALSENDPDTGDPRFGLFAIGGDGLGTDTDADGDFGANGGSGGQIFVSAGHVAEEGAIVLGSAAQAVRLDRATRRPSRALRSGRSASSHTVPTSPGTRTATAPRTTSMASSPGPISSPPAGARALRISSTPVTRLLRVVWAAAAETSRSRR
jgi:hypothetical protein